MMEDLEVHSFLQSRAATATWITSVCTGALVIDAAGLLRGYQATMHWVAREVIEETRSLPVCRARQPDLEWHLEVERGHLELNQRLDECLEQLEGSAFVTILPLTARIAVESTRLGARFHAEPMDQIGTGVARSAHLTVRDAQALCEMRSRVVMIENDGVWAGYSTPEAVS